MPKFDIFTDDRLRLVKVVAQGELFQGDGEAIISAARTKAMENKYDILYDIRQATTTVLFSSWFELPRKLEVFQEEESWNVKAAILASPDDKAVDEYRYYETIIAELGFKLRVFFNEDEALKWLQKRDVG